MAYGFVFNGNAWFLEIKDLETLNAYLEMAWSIRHDELERDRERISKKLHPSSDIIGICETFANMRGTGTELEFKALKARQTADMTRMIGDGLTLYVSPRGGYCMSLNGIENRCTQEDLQWPVFSEEDIRIKQWPDGTHWYAYIGPVQVKDGEIQKWGSESDARMAARRYVNSKVKPKMR